MGLSKVPPPTASQVEAAVLEAPLLAKSYEKAGKFAALVSHLLLQARAVSGYRELSGFGRLTTALSEAID
jgi:hypothetical protein